MSAQTVYTPKFRVVGYIFLAGLLPVAGLLLVVYLERHRRRKLRREQLTA